MFNKNISPYIFREYDIRGIYGKDINDDTAYTIGVAFGTYIQKLGKKQCLIGHDNRLSSPALTTNLINGILNTGTDVVFLGLVTTPMYYYARDYLDISSGIMVTASHNPKDDNGFKLAFDERGNARGEMIRDFYRFIQEEEMLSGAGTLTKYDIKDEYIKLFVSHINPLKKRLKVIIDCGNGTTTIIAKELYEKFNIDLEVLFGDSDGNFPNHHPDPSIRTNLEVLCETVVKYKADVGIAFDGDGDRVGVIDNHGEFVTMDKYMILMIRDIIKTVSNKTFLYDVKCSKAVEDEILRLGGTPLCYRTGNSYTKAKVLDDNLPFGGELSGHVYFNDRFKGFDSGLYAGLRLIELLANSEDDLHTLLESIPEYFVTDEIKIPTEDSKKNDLIEKVKDYALSCGYSILTIDGVKVLFDDGFALVRASNTGPNITARFEGKTIERMKALEKEFLDKLAEFSV